MSYKYEVIRELGAGGFGTVFKAKEKDIALKVIYIKDAVHKLEIEREIAILQNLQHKNIVKYIGCNLVTSNDNFIIEIKRMTNYMAATIVMELCDHSLASELKSRHLVVPNESFNIFKEITDGVQYIHSNGIIHRDLKPENILIKFENGASFIKISDFGLSKCVSTPFPIKHSGIKGTPGYRAPEQQDPNVTYNYKVDIFSLGIILTELYTIYPVTHWLKDFWDKKALPPIPYGEIISLIKDMTNLDPNKRPDSTDILKRISPQPKNRFI
jgi:serine/threonine protein kinase